MYNIKAPRKATNKGLPLIDLSDSKNWELSAAVVIFVYNRPGLTQLLIDKIRQVKPKKLFIVADGPKPSEDPSDCLKVRSLLENFDWEVEIERNYANSNLGVTDRIITGLDWVFSHVDKAIILEDDCIPELSFFRFCDQLLDHYQNDKNVMHISGFNFGQSFEATHSYIFSHYVCVWGWATWARAWRKFNPHLNTWQKNSKMFMKYISPENRSLFDLINRHITATRMDWDIPWAIDVLNSGGLGIYPTKNLVTNQGFGPGGTHTKDPNSAFSKIKAHSMAFPLKHPPQKITKYDPKIEAIYFRLLRELIARS